MKTNIHNDLSLKDKPQKYKGKNGIIIKKKNCAVILDKLFCRIKLLEILRNEANYKFINTNNDISKTRKFCTVHE